MGASPLVWSDLFAWCFMHRVTLNSWELDTLMAMDNAAMAELGRIQREERELQKAKKPT